MALERVKNESKFVTNELLKKFVRKGSTIVTDEGNAFVDIPILVDEEGKSIDYSHETVCHAGQYCSGGVWSYFKGHDSQVHNNCMEGKFALFLFAVFDCSFY